MATVYLAIQTSVDREVALKVMSPTLLVDPNFGERFLREARIAAKLHHRHVVGIHDVGSVGEYNYMAMEYLSGGTIFGADGAAREPVFSLRVVREIAAALAYAHNKGFVHRDVKPDNILLREDGAAALTDFGIARATDSATRMTRTGAVIGTPHYMSPEQARGKPIDGRADLYSLGIVLYEILTGRVPYQAEDSLAVGIMHITEPLPRLPDHLADLQPLLDQFLAKQPEQRFQNGAEAVNAIRAIEQRMLRGELPRLGQISASTRERMLADMAEEASRRKTPTGARASVPSPPPPKPNDIPTAKLQQPQIPKAQQSPAAPRRAAAADPMAMRDEPQLGDVAGISAEPNAWRRRNYEREDRGGGSRLPLIAGITLFAVGLIGGGAWMFQDKLRALIPSSQTVKLLSDAERAVGERRLEGPNSASEIYKKVLAADPDNEAARAGLTQVGVALVAEAQSALKEGNLATAKAKAAAAREILQGGPMLDVIDAALAQADSRSIKVNELLEKAQAAQTAGNFDEPEKGAIALFRRVLDVDPDNAIAKKGVREIAGVLNERAVNAIDAGDKARAEQLVTAIAALMPDYAALPALRARLSDRDKESAANRDAQLIRAEALMKAGALVTPAGASAADAYRAVLAVDPNNAKARAGLSKIGATLVLQANASLENGDAATASRQIAEAESLGAPAAELAAVKNRLREIKDKLAVAAATPTVTPDQQQRIDKYVSDAEAAIAAGNLFDPPGGNAFDMYRAALGIDRSNAKANQGLAALPDRAREAFTKAIAEGRPNSARSYLDGLDQIAPTDPNGAARKVTLARAYVKQAESQMGDQQFEAAIKSLNRARELSPSEPEIAAAEAKLKTLRGGS